MDIYSFCSLSRKTSRLLTSSKLSVPVCFLLKPRIPPSYLALTLEGAGGGFGVEVAGWFEASTARGLCASAVLAVSAKSRLTPKIPYNFFIDFSPSDVSDD